MSASGRIQVRLVGGGKTMGWLGRAGSRLRVVIGLSGGHFGLAGGGSIYCADTFGEAAHYAQPLPPSRSAPALNVNRLGFAQGPPRRQFSFLLTCRRPWVTVADEVGQTATIGRVVLKTQASDSSASRFGRRRIGKRSVQISGTRPRGVPAHGRREVDGGTDCWDTTQVDGR